MLNKREGREVHTFALCLCKTIVTAVTLFSVEAAVEIMKILCGQLIFGVQLADIRSDALVILRLVTASVPGSQNNYYCAKARCKIVLEFGVVTRP